MNNQECTNCSQVYKKITPEDLWSEKKIFQPKSIPGLRSMESGLTYTSLEDKKKIVQYSYETGERVDTLFDAELVKSSGITEIAHYELSHDEKRILLATKTQKIYRHSFYARFYVWNVEKKSLTALSRRTKMQLATFSPDGNKVAFVSNNDLFIKDLAKGEETRITTDGRINHIINGVSDWVYEEEFGLKCAYTWSPDGAYLAYLRFDESRVKQFTMQRFNGGYPNMVEYKYPRAGEDNSIVSVYIYDVNAAKVQRVDVGDESDQYIPRIKWTKTPGELAVMRLNRLQNRLDLLACNASDGKSKVFYTEENERYTEPDDSLTFLDDKKHFILVSEQSGWRHVHLFDMNGGGTQITKGEWDMTEYHGFNNENQRIYYTAAVPTPLHRTLYSVKIDGTDEKKLSTEDGANSAAFSKGFRYYINTFSSANTPPVITLHDATGDLVRVLEDNSALNKILEDYDISYKEFFKFTTSEGIELNGWMIKPPSFDEKKEYPVLMTVYGGPNSQTVTQGWGMGWDQYLAQEGYIVASVDGRGTGGRGEDFRKCTYLQLGKYEVIDQVEGAKYLGTLPYVDASRIGIFGWSYGGFMASGCILRGAEVFKTAVAVASVTNFRYYDTIYTERFMRTPQENPTGYDENAPLSYAKNLEGKLLLVHGITDDNVHYQNSLELVEALVKESKQFEVHFLPNRDHSITGGTTHMNLYPKMTDFLKRNL